MAWCYDSLARAYSLGRIARAKDWAPRRLPAGARILYVGCGGGEDALEAARAGLRVTALDVSARMLALLEARLRTAGASAELVRADLFEYEPSEPFDAVAAHFVLNVFEPALMRRALERIGRWVRAEGLLGIADFAPPAAGRSSRVVQYAYYRPLNVAAWLLRLAALHPIYDYAVPLRELGWQVEGREGHRVPAAGPVLYQTLIARCPAAPRGAPRRIAGD